MRWLKSSFLVILVLSVAALFLGGGSHFTLPARGLGAVGNGDSNGDGSIDISDATYLLSWLFLGGPKPVPIDAVCQDDPVDLVRLGLAAELDGFLGAPRGQAQEVLPHLILGAPAEVPGKFVMSTTRSEPISVRKVEAPAGKEITKIAFTNTGSETAYVALDGDGLFVRKLLPPGDSLTIDDPVIVVVILVGGGLAVIEIFVQAAEAVVDQIPSPTCARTNHVFSPDFCTGGCAPTMQCVATAYKSWFGIQGGEVASCGCR